jgi:hypothetical protein
VLQQLVHVATPVVGVVGVVRLRLLSFRMVTLVFPPMAALKEMLLCLLRSMTQIKITFPYTEWVALLLMPHLNLSRQHLNLSRQHLNLSRQLRKL